MCYGPDNPRVVGNLITNIAEVVRILITIIVSCIAITLLASGTTADSMLLHGY